MPNRRVVRIAVPAKLSNLIQMLEAADVADPDDTIVLYSRGELVVEEPQPTLIADVDEEQERENAARAEA